MKNYENEKSVETTQGGAYVPPLTYEERVVNRIRVVYSLDDEIAILRQKDTKPEEYAEYFCFVEKIKEEEQSI